MAEEAPAPLDQAAQSNEAAVDAYLRAAELAKDRLHTLQTTEWNMFYGVWVIILVTLYAILTGFNEVFAQLGTAIATLCPRLLPVTIRAIRLVVAMLAVFLFFRHVASYYLRDFYGTNYKSLTTQRTLYNLYVARALAIATAPGENLGNLPPQLRYKFGAGGWKLNELAQEKTSDDASQANAAQQEPGRTRTRPVDYLRLHVLPLPERTDDPKVEEVLLPRQLADTIGEYSRSGLYIGRARVMILVMRFGIVLAGLIAFSAPMKPDMAGKAPPPPPAVAQPPATS